MNYNRRANRPDANYYRESRRRGLKGDSSGVARPRGRGWLLLLLPFLLIAVVAGWLMWRGL